MAVYLQRCHRQLLCQRNAARASAPALWAGKLERPFAPFRVLYEKSDVTLGQLYDSRENGERKVSAMGWLVVMRYRGVESDVGQDDATRVGRQSCEEERR